MHFTKRLRDGVRRGEVTCSVRIWQRPRVIPGHRYRMEDGEIEVDSIMQIELADITPQLARESGFASVIDLLKTAKHGRGTNVYLVRFHYLAKGAHRSGRKARARTTTPTGTRKPPSSQRQRKRIARILARLPEATAAGTQHLSLEVRKRRFGYFLDDHHGDGRIALNCKAGPDLHDMLRERAPAQFHIPKYLGNKGWIGLWLDHPDVDWSLVEIAIREAYLLVAPKTLVRTL
jgi:hypothetical protein